jgi:hypothetical protein
MKLKLRIFPSIYPIRKWEYELTNDKIYLCSMRDGFSSVASAKKSAHRLAARLNITITDTEIDPQT